jgi:hypothetical protein
VPYVTSEEIALNVWRDVHAPAMLDRLRTGASGEPMTYRVLIPARNLSGKALGEVLEIANAHKVGVGVDALNGHPMLVLV